MLRYSLPLALLLASTCAAIPVRAQQAAPPQQNKKVWTNADMDELRARGDISIVGPEAPAATSETIAPAKEFLAGPVYADRLQDPVWYADQATGLQAELTARAVALAQAQTSLADARNGRGATGSINMAAGDTYGITPDDAIAHLQEQLSDTQTRLDDLADLARRYDIAQGVLRDAAV